MKNTELVNIALSYPCSREKRAASLRKVRQLLKGELPSGAVLDKNVLEGPGVYRLPEESLSWRDFLKTIDKKFGDGGENGLLFDNVVKAQGSPKLLTPNGQTGTFKEHGTYFGRSLDELTNYFPNNSFVGSNDTASNFLSIAHRNKFSPEHYYTQTNPGAALHVVREIHPSYTPSRYNGDVEALQRNLINRNRDYSEIKGVGDSLNEFSPYYANDYLVRGKFDKFEDVLKGKKFDSWEKQDMHPVEREMSNLLNRVSKLKEKLGPENARLLIGDRNLSVPDRIRYLGDNRENFNKVRKLYEDLLIDAQPNIDPILPKYLVDRYIK